MTFFLPCGFTYTTQALALSSGNSLKAFFIMLFFVL
ncbi:MAG: sulfite exporter TauE/SafE family protein [Candidatus Peribacteria bacterium]|nr:sulfite exporter TauE/SafE family protein [Candidatus Peribacteria bacterium]